uniref:KRAB domain-containing protein n=1 Tax=Crocodylus porosus TaxID=8502 RepID=A0A7M4ER44_CROPO
FTTGLVTLEEVAVCFPEKQRSPLDSSQRALYQDVMLEKNETLVSLGKNFCLHKHWKL